MAAFRSDLKSVLTAGGTAGPSLADPHNVPGTGLTVGTWLAGLAMCRPCAVESS